MVGIKPGGFHVGSAEPAPAKHRGKYAEVYVKFEELEPGSSLPVHFATKAEALQAKNSIAKYLRKLYGPTGPWKVSKRGRQLLLINVSLKHNSKSPGPGKSLGAAAAAPGLPDPESLLPSPEPAVEPNEAVAPAATNTVPPSAANSAEGSIVGDGEGPTKTSKAEGPSKTSKALPPDLVGQMETGEPTLSIYEEEFGAPKRKPSLSSKEATLRRIRGEE